MITLIITVIIINIISYIIGYKMGINNVSKKQSNNYYYRSVSDFTTNKKIEFFYNTTGDIPKWDSNINLKNINVISDKNKKNILIDKINKAIDIEDYEAAAKYRDIFNDLENKNSSSS